MGFSGSRVNLLGLLCALHCPAFGKTSCCFHFLKYCWRTIAHVVDPQHADSRLSKAPRRTAV